MYRPKPYCISRKSVQEAYLKIKANKGAAGVDQMSMETFNKEPQKHLYKLWNQMSSGSYMPPTIKLVEIPKKDGGKRPLGIPTITDRIGQAVVTKELEQVVDNLFHEDSFGYRPKKSALQAVAKAREMCMRYEWVLDVDIKGFFGAPGEVRQLQQVQFLSQKGLSLPTENRALSLLGNETG